MSFAVDLLEQAHHLIGKDGTEAKEASLRRAVSTAYYALFHLLIDEAVCNWAIVRHRGKLARTFDHGSMKRICEDQIRIFHSTGRPESLVGLKEIARTFVELQGARHIADYDNSYTWTRADAQVWIDNTQLAFDNWRAIRTQDEAQDFLLSLFLPKQPRQ